MARFPLLIIKAILLFVKDKKKCGGKIPPHEALLLFLPEGLAVSALIHSGITLVGTYQNVIQSAVVAVITVVCALLNGAFNALICVAIHNDILLLF